MYIKIIAQFNLCVKCTVSQIMSGIYCKSDLVNTMHKEIVIYLINLRANDYPKKSTIVNLMPKALVINQFFF